MKRLGISLTSAVAVAALTLAAATTALADLEGRYVVSGQNPGGQGSYNGVAAVQENDGTYTVAWKVGQQQYAGTGILRKDVFSVVYQTGGDRSRPGLVVYEVRDDGTLVGVWTTLGSSNTGLERWRPMDQKQQ
jgi:hypothetical protein